MRLASCALAVVALALVLGACGESSEDKAKSTVCDAREDIGKQVDALKSLTPATVTTDAVTQHVTAIKDDLEDIAGAQADLSSDRRSEVESATKTFTNSVQTIASDALRSLSAADAKTALTTAVQQLQASYQKTLAPLDCG
jgi:Skp family chaperone for outer membrane proteins